MERDPLQTFKRGLNRDRHLSIERGGTISMSLAAGYVDYYIV
jgi:hypothetical protein